MFAADVARFIERHDLLPEGARVLVGLSGGVDSVVLVHVLRRLGYAVRAMHVNYGLRGAASDGDEAFVRAWCEELGVPLEATRFDTRAEAAARGRSLQEAARVLRYAWFADRCRARGVAHVAVAHHLDDQVETVLLHLFRGSGPEGLAGMPVRRPLDAGGDVLLVRPLLCVRRAAVEDYARAEGLAWRTDASNASLKYRRTAVREAVLPVVEAHFGPGVYDSVARTAGLMRGYVDAGLHPSLEAAFAVLAHVEAEGGGSLALDGLRRVESVWRHRLILEALRRWLPGSVQSRAVAEAVAALLDAQPGRRVALPQGTVWRDRRRLHFVPGVLETAVAERATHPLEHGAAVPLPHGTLRLERLDAAPERLDAGTPDVAFVDAGRLAFPLAVRPWRDGDRLRPLGMDGFKKVSDYLTDARVPPHRRRDVYVVCSGDDVVWIVGHRLDHRFRVRPDTSTFAKILFLRSKTGNDERT